FTFQKAVYCFSPPNNLCQYLAFNVTTTSSAASQFVDLDDITFELLNPDLDDETITACNQSVTIGPDISCQSANPEVHYLWSPGGQTSAQITVSPSVTT